MEVNSFSPISNVRFSFQNDENEINKLKEIAKNLDIQVEASDDIKQIERKILPFAQSDFEKLKQLDGDQSPSFFKSLIKLSALYQKISIILNTNLLVDISLQLISMGLLEEAFDSKLTARMTPQNIRAILEKALENMSPDKLAIYIQGKDKMLIQLIDLIPKTDLVLNHLYLFYEITDQSKAEQKALKIYEQIKNSNYKLALKLLDFMELPIKDYELTRVISSLSYKDEEKIFSLLPQISNKEQQALALCSLYPFNDRGQYIKDEFLPELYSDEENIDTAGINYVDINAFLSFVDRLPEKFDYAKDNLYKKVAISLIENEFFLGIDIANRIKNATIRESVFDSFFGEDDFHCHYWLDVVTTMEDAFKLIEKLNEVSLKKHFFLDLLGSLYCVESIDSERQSGKIMVPIERLGEVVALFENIVGKYIPAINLIERISDTSLKKALMKGYALEYAAAGKMPFRLCHAMSEADVNLIITTFMNSLPGKKTPGNYINQSLNLIASENPALGKRSLFSLNSGTFNAKTAEMLLLNKPIGSWFVRYSDRTRTYIFCFKIDDYKVAQKTIKAPISLELMEAELNQVFPESLRVEVKFVT